MTQIQVYAEHGNPTNADCDRAKKAAEAILGKDALSAYEAFMAQSDNDNKEGLAVLFEDAQRAANLALTNGWADPDAGWCRIEVYA